MTNKYQHQDDLQALSPDKYLLVWDCGTGKTKAAIDLVEQKTFDVLVIVPKALVKSWEKEIKQWSNGKTAYEIQTKETFKKNELQKTIRRYDAVIIDEAHNFAGMKSQMSKSMIAYLKKHEINYVYCLTATPFLSQPWNVYRLGQILGTHWGYQKFEYTFFYSFNMGGRMVPMLKSGTEEKLAEYVHKLGIPVRMDEAVDDLPESTMLTEFFKLSKEQEKLMEEAYDPNPLVRFTREHQICGGTLKGDEFTDSIIFKSDKRQRVLDLAEKNDKLVVVCRYNLEIDALENALREVGSKVYVVRGDTKDRHGVLQSARNDDKAVLLVSAACSEGWEFPECRIMVFYSYDFSLKNYIQLLGRIQRINKIAKRTYLSLIVKGTIDEDVMDNISKKKSFHIHIYAKTHK